MGLHTDGIKCVSSTGCDLITIILAKRYIVLIVLNQAQHFSS